MKPSFQGNAVALLPALGLYLAACATPALHFWNTNSQAEASYFGIHTLLMGPLAILGGQLSWFANLFFAAGALALLLGHCRVATVFAVIALPITAHALSLYGHALPANEGGVGELQLRSFGPGFYLWVASAAALAIGALVRHRSSRQT